MQTLKYVCIIGSVQDLEVCSRVCNCSHCTVFLLINPAAKRICWAILLLFVPGRNELHSWHWDCGATGMYRQLEGQHLRKRHVPCHKSDSGLLKE